MSLDWNVSKVKDFGTVCWVDDPRGNRDTKIINPVTDAIIWACLRYDLGSVTKTNIDEWMYRQHLLAQLGEYPMYDKGGEDVLIKREELEQHIGLTTNVSTKRRSEFEKKVFDKMRRDAVASAIKDKVWPVEAI